MRENLGCTRTSRLGQAVSGERITGGITDSNVLSAGNRNNIERSAGSHIAVELNITGTCDQCQRTGTCSAVVNTAGEDNITALRRAICTACRRIDGDATVKCDVGIEGNGSSGAVITTSTNTARRRDITTEVGTTGVSIRDGQRTANTTGRRAITPFGVDSIYGDRTVCRRERNIT